MEYVTAKKTDLLQELRKNRANHRKVFREAQKGYRKRAIEELDRALRDARKGGNIRLRIELPYPEDHTADYDRAIKMLEMSTKATMEINSIDFAHFVMDDWPWKGQFSKMSSTYAS